jgi:dTDP-4-amino-4,6-dideoxygalactose transaminase
MVVVTPEPTIPHSRPDLGADEAEAARRTVAGGQVAQGPVVAAFEEDVAALMGRRYGVATSCGTAALQLVLQALDVAGRQVLMPGYVCSALVHAIHAAHAIPTLADVDGVTGNMDALPGHLGKEVAAAIVPHMFGRPATAVAQLSSRLPVVEDLAMALGADGVGGHGVAAVCSFYATKVITSGGEGGMVLTDDQSLAQTFREMREYDGLLPDRQRWNYKLTDVGAAVGRVQLRRLPQLLERRRALTALYDEVSQGWAVVRPHPHSGDIHYRYVVSLDAGRLQAAIAAFDEQGVAARRPVPGPLHGVRSDDGTFPGTRQMLHRALSLPLYPSLSDADAQRVVGVADRVLSPTRVPESCR